jgi:hypothetical protein
MKRILAATLVLLLAMPMTACMTYRHSVGKGGTSHTVVAEKAQWFILWGLIPLSPSPSVDGGKLAKDNNLSDYTIQTQYTALDVLITFFTNFVTIHKQTVTVEK